MSYRKITVENKTYISPLQMYGPIINPINVSNDMVINLVRKGYTVNEKLKNGKMIRLNLYNMRNPYATVTTAPQTTPVKRVVPETSIPKPTVAPVVTPKIEVPTETISMFDDGVRDYGEVVSAVDVVPVEETIVPTKVNAIPATPEERGITVTGITEMAEEEQPEEEPVAMATSVEEDTDDEVSSEFESEEVEAPTDSNNQTRRNKKKKRR